MFTLFDPAGLVQTLKLVGYFGIAIIVFTKSELFFRFILPRDSLYEERVTILVPVGRIPSMYRAFSLQGILIDHFYDY